MLCEKRKYTRNVKFIIHHWQRKYLDWLHVKFGQHNSHKLSPKDSPLKVKDEPWLLSSFLFIVWIRQSANLYNFCTPRPLHASRISSCTDYENEKEHSVPWCAFQVPLSFAKAYTVFLSNWQISCLGYFCPVFLFQLVYNILWFWWLKVIWVVYDRFSVEKKNWKKVSFCEQWLWLTYYYQFRDKFGVFRYRIN